MEKGLELKNISFGYGEKKILEVIDVSFPKAGLVVLLGRSGSGKTTFLSLCSGLLKPQEGEIQNHFGKEPALCFQSPLLLSYLNVEENILLPLESKGIEGSKEKVQEVLAEVGLSGYEERSVSSLSGGEKIRVSLARALIQDSPFLLLDEPTGGLDSRNSRSVYALLKKLSETRLLLVVTHDEKEAREYSLLSYELKDRSIVLTSKKEYIETPSTCSRPLKSEKGCFSLKSSIRINCKFLKRHRIRVFFCVFFLGFSLSLLSLGLNLYRNLDRTLPSFFSSYLSYPVMSLSENRTITDDGSLTLKQSTLPKKKSIKDMGIDCYYPDLGYFLPSYNELSVNRRYQDVLFSPVLHMEKSVLKEGRIARNAKEAVVNASFLDCFHITSQEAIGKSFRIVHSSLLYLEDKESKDLVKAVFPFTIVGISSESSFFNEPTLYYPYFPVLESLGEYIAVDLSEECKEEVSARNVLEWSLDSSSDITGRKILFESKDPFSTKEKAKKDENLVLGSKVLEVYSSTKELFVSLSKVLGLFLVLSLFSAVMLEFLSVYSLYSNNLRLFALSKAFTRDKKGLLRIASGTGLLFFVFTLLLTAFLSLSGEGIIRFILSRLGMPPLLVPFDLLSYLPVLFLVFLLSALSALLPLSRIRDSSLKKELEAEE